MQIGFIHLSDLRAPPDYGRIAYPEDIFGSLEVTAEGEVIADSFTPSGSYRVLTRDGMLGLTEFLRGCVVRRLGEMERGERVEGEV